MCLAVNQTKTDIVLKYKKLSKDLFKRFFLCAPSGVTLTNILCEAFTLADPKSVKIY